MKERRMRMFRQVFSYLSSLSSLLVLAFCSLNVTASAQVDACSPTKPNTKTSTVNIPEVGTPKTPAAGVADGWVLLYKDSEFRHLQSEVYCQQNKIRFASSVGKKKFDEEPNCKTSACTKAVATGKVSKVILKGAPGSYQFKWGVKDFAINGFTVLYNFAGSATGDGANPRAPLMQAPSGSLYGTTYAGGGLNVGTVFELDASGAETVLHSFSGSDGKFPIAGLVRDSSGNFYGTASQGGTGSRTPGVVYELGNDGTLTVLHSFSVSGAPESGLVLDSLGNLYGTSVKGGAISDGQVYLVNGSTFSTLYSFPSQSSFPVDYGALVMDGAGTLYGTTSAVGGSGYGSVFKLDSSGNETTLYSFAGGTSDGCYPDGSVVMDGSGNLYGTTTLCGTANAGTVWKLDSAGNETVLYSFTGGTDGSTPDAGLVLDSSGNLYGVTVSGGDSNGDGVLFEVSSNGTETVLHTFASATDGSTPIGGLLLGSDGNLYGTASAGGIDGFGTVWGYNLFDTLAVTLAGTGTGAVSSSPAGINCPTACSAPFAPSTMVSLTEIPGPNSVFGGWSGACSGIGACQVAISGATNVTATFSASTSQTTTTVAPSQNPSQFGQTTTFFATVTTQNGTPTGTVTFYDGTSVLGTQSLSSGAAQYSSSSLAVGSHSITAVYSGDSNDQGSTSSPLNETINQASQTITITVPPPPTATNKSSFTVAATASSGLPVSFGSAGACTNVGATFTVTKGAGTCTVTASQSGDANYLPAPNVTETTTVVKAIVPTVSFTGAPTGAAYLDAFTVVATSNASSIPTIIATGACTISGTTVTMSRGTGTCNMKAEWAADDVYKAASAVQKTTAEKIASVINWATPASITYGTALSATELDATANIAGKFFYTPAMGKVLGAGSQTLSLRFTPTDSTDYSAATAMVQLTVNPADTTATITQATPNPSMTGQAVKVDFNVTPGKPTGNVTISASSGETCTETLASGKGSCTLALNTAGTITLTATYAGDANNNGSRSGPYTQTVN